MYCLEKLQRELAYFFDMDLRELPRVQDLLAAKGYTQVQKGDEIIKLEPSTPAESSLATPKQKTIEKVDTYASTPEFQTLSKDKQEAILSLKTIEPSPMPQEVTQENLENLLKHFNSKQDRAQREFYAKLFNDTKEKPHITLEVKRDNETRQEYIKAYQHKDTHDLYYIAITKDNDTIKVTGYPITKIKDVINQIKNAEKVVWRHQGDQAHTALDFKKSPNLESAENIIPQSTTPLSKQAQDYAHQILQGLHKTAQTPLNKLADEVRSIDRGFMLREARYIKQRAQEFADSFANLRGQDLRAVIRYAKVPYDEAMFKELKAGIESKEFAKFIESSYPNKPTQKSLFDTQELTAPKVDSSVETKELHTKTTSKLTKDELDNLPIATAQEFGEFLEKIAQKDYQNTPEILKIATLNNDLQELINNNHSASVFITRARAGHISEARKGEYDQALTLEEQKQIPAEIAQAKQAYTDDKSGFILPFADKNNSEKINLIILDSDSKGNFLITAKKVNSAELNNPKYKKLARAGVEPATTTPPKAEQKPTEAISLARDEIIPQTQMPKDNSDPVKTFEYFRDDFIKEYPKALESYSGQIPLPSELSFGVEQSLLKEIRTIKEAMNNTAKDKFKELLNNIGLKQNEITQVLDTTIRSDIDYTLDSVKEYLDYVARHLENFPPEHKPIAQEILAHRQNILNIFENKTPQIQQLQKKRELITSFHNNAKTSNTKEQDLLKGLIDELYKPQSKQTPKALESTPKDAPPPTQKGLFDEVDSSVAYTDTKGHTHQIPSDIAQKWLETFGLKDLQETYTPQFSEQVAQALEPILQGSQITLSANSLVKLMQRDRLEFLPYIKETLEHSDIIIKDKENALIFAKDIGQTSYFTSVSKNDKGEWVISTNSYKTLSQLKNRVSENGEVLYLSKEAPNILAETFTTKAFSNELASDIIPQPISFDALPTPAQNLIKKLLHQIRRLEKSPSFREHDKIIAELKKSNDTQMLANLLKSFDERYPSAKDHYLLSGLRDSIQNTLNKLSNPHIAKVLHTFTEKSPNPQAQAQAIKELYHRYGEESLKDLFDKVLSAAGDVKFSIRQTYANANGKYSADKHLITLNRRWALDTEPQRLAQTLLHELIHATIARAQYHRFSPQAFPELAHKLTPAQKAAVQEIDNLYILAFKNHQAQKRAKTLADDELELYGFTNSKEFVAELANPKFRSYLEKQNIFKRVLEAIVKFFTGGEGEQTTILKALQESYEKFLDNFGESSESFFGKKEGGASPSENRTLFDKADSSESFSYTTGEAKGIAELRKDLKAALEPYKSTPITNKETGLQGVVTDTERNKISSKKAVDKSIANGFTRDEHFAAAQDLKNLFENATKAQSHNDYKQRENIAQVHRFVKDLYINDKQAQAKITLFEKIEGKNRIYTLELESLSPTPKSSPHTQAGVAVEAQVTRDVVRPNANIAKTDEQIVAQDSNALLESTMKSFKYDERKAKHEQREQTKAILSPLINKPITNQNDGRVAQISRKNIAKMISDKAVAKSVANGFEPAEHFKAVQEVDKLYQKARLKETHKDFKGDSDNVLIHRYDTKTDNANVLLTLKETLKGDYKGNKIYSLELETLELKPTLPEPQGSETMSRNTIRKAIVTPTETLGESIAQKLQTLKTKQDKLSKQIDEYKHKHNIPAFTGFGKSAIQIDDPYYQSLQAEYSDSTKQIQALQLQLARQATPQSTASKLESTKVSASPNPYQDFETTPQSWADIEKVKGQDYIDSLKQWHNHSHKSTKNTDGSPKVFYHGTRSDKFEVFEVGESESGREGIYFSTSPNIAKDYDIWDQGVYEVFLHYKNPLEVDFKGTPYNSKQGREILKTIPQKLSKDHDAIIYKNIRDDNQRGAGELADTIVVFEPNQIKHIENRGIESESGRKYFNDSSPNIFQSSPHAGAGLLGGSAAGVEQDENGEWHFSPEKFALGLLGGSAGSIAISKAKNTLKSKAKMQGQKVEIAIPKEKDFKTLKLESESYLNSLKDTTITNKETGMQATIARKGTKEIISNVKKSVANGFSFNEHFAVASNLKEVFENAIFAKKLSDTKHNDPRVNIYRFNSAIILNGKEANALITLKEYLENGKRLYALELEELSKAKFIP